MRSVKHLIAAAMIASIAAPAVAQDAAGEWYGTLEVAPGAKLPLVLHIKRGADGALAGTLDSPAQGALDIPLADVTATDGSLALKVPAVGGAYTATWDAAAKAWTGQWSQNGQTWPLTFGAPKPPEPAPVGWQIPSNDEIAALIAQRNAPRVGQGIVVGVIEPGSERVIAGGPANGSAFGADTVFEIGSISKVFTALILADMANKGEVALDDPAEKYLPGRAKMPERGGRKITLRDLSTHVSGLPRLGANMPVSDIDDPYFDYTDALMLEFLASYELPRDIGSRFEYSNFAVELLGWLLGRAAGKDYETLLRERITGPLGMRDTSVTLSAEQQARFPQGYDAYMRPAKPWRFPRPGAGGIRSTVDDMLKFAAAALDPNSPIGPAMKTTLSVRVPGNAGYEQALGWQVGKQPGSELLVHNGGTGGFRSVIALMPGKGRAVVALANSTVEPAPTDLGLHIIAGFPMAATPAVPAAPPPPVERSEVALPQTELSRVVGRYDFGGGVQFAVTLEGGKLTAQRLGAITGPVLEIFPEAPLAFFWKAVDAQIRFTVDDDGKVVGAEFTQDGSTLPGRKLGL